MRRGVVRSLVAACVLAVLSAGGALAVTPIVALHLSASQLYPSGNAVYLAFTSNTVAKPNQWNALAYDRTSHATLRLNALQTKGYTGGFDPGTNTVVFQQTTPAGSSGIYLYDLDTSTRSPFDAVNTAAWEWDPRMSSTYLSFLRDAGHRELLLYERGSGHVHAVATIRDGTAVQNGSVGDRYVTWTTCRGVCVAHVFDTDTSTGKTIPGVQGRSQFAPVVDEATGQVFFARSGPTCGDHAAIWKVPVAHLRATPTRVAALPDGSDVDLTMSLAENPDTGATDLLFTHVGCGAGGTDIWAAPGVIGP